MSNRETVKRAIAEWANEWDLQPLAPNHTAVETSLVDRIEAALLAERERCAKIADLWANSHSCDSHDTDPCCHVRTGISIAAAIRKET